MLNKRMTVISSFKKLISISFLGLLVGCGNGLDPDYAKLGLVEISGKVTLDGEPLPGVQVVFEESKFVYSYGNTDASGQYTLMFDSRKKGIVPGAKTVRFKSKIPAGEQGAPDEEEDPDAKPLTKSAIPDCYDKNSKLFVEVTTSSNNFNFDLKSDCSTTGSN